MSRIVATLCCILFLMSPAFAQTLERPTVKPGDFWAYQTTIEQTANQMQRTPGQWTEKHYEVTAIRAGSTSILVSRKERGSKQPPLEIMAGSDWSKRRSIDGEETVVSQPLSFPLQQGKKWQLKFIQNNPNREYKYHETQLDYAVAGWEEISVSAGKFRALKIEAEGRWKVERTPSANTSTSSRTDQDGTVVVMQANRAKPRVSTGRLYHAYWYVPETKVYVKAIEEHFFTNGTLARRNTEELESFKLSQ